ncbi:energy transducer TonB [Yoonia sp. BS5-3]|uniref:Energy transducer TonB n=1 Tax=Yoonia phaeophyticola TaxID=3137369 RepID=A0ABZ3IEJ3_9RHOB
MRVPLGLGGAFMASLALHASGILASAPPKPLVVIDGAPPGVALLGDSFADMAMGAPSSPPVTAAASPFTEAATQAETPPQTAETVVPDITPTATGTLAISPTPPVAATAPVTPTAPPAPAEAAETSPLETVTAVNVPVVQTPDADTIRPQRRPADLGQEPPEPAPQPPRQQTASSSGNADQNATRGSTEGQQNGQATAASNGANNDATNAATARAAANYQGQVLRQINSTRIERLNARGTAIIAFSISPSGTLASVSVARSSGNARIDQAGMNHIQRAAPFPPPPPGAQTRFQVEFEGR